MRLRGLLVALIAAAVLGGLIFWSNKDKEAEAKKPPKDSSPKLVSLAEGDIQQVEIARKSGETTILKRVGDNWEITSPAVFKADKDAASSLVTSLASLSADKLVDEKPANLADFGLTEPAITVTITRKDGKTTRLLVGDDTPTSTGTFAKLDGDPKVYTIASWTKTSLDKPAKDLRDKRLLVFDTEKLVRVELNAKNSVTEFAKNNQNEWQILKPRPYRADGFQVEELIRKLKDAKLDTAISDEEAKKAPAQFASGTLVAVATITDNAGSQRLEVRKTKDNKYFAKSSVIDGVYSIPADTGAGLDKSTDDFRNKKVFDFGFSDPIKVDYKDAAHTLALAKSGEKWVNGVKEQDSVSVQSLIDKLRDMTAVKFADGTLPSPAINLTVVSNEGKRTEKVALGKKGETWYAQRENEPSLYEIAPAAIEALQKAAGDVKEAAPPPAKDAKKK
ncbi:MAG: DUF4340 domain-containing protein [Bryobacterales bacterium]|nr:DUF4340 domain-containing protein [Bryobacterales bacterium]